MRLCKSLNLGCGILLERELSIRHIQEPVHTKAMHFAVCNDLSFCRKYRPLSAGLGDGNNSECGPAL